jgi:hypothetical protein
MVLPNWQLVLQSILFAIITAALFKSTLRMRSLTLAEATEKKLMSLVHYFLTATNNVVNSIALHLYSGCFRFGLSAISIEIFVVFLSYVSAKIIAQNEPQPLHYKPVYLHHTLLYFILQRL